MSDGPINYKMVILGESGVGKTCVMNSFLGQKFEEEHLTTIGAEQQNKTLNIDDKIVKINLWDTAGQESFRAITKMFYKGADIVVLVYDITNERSFEEIKNYWYKEVQNNTDNLSGKINFIIFFPYYFYNF